MTEKTEEIDDLTKGYVAGLFDGEGSVYINKRNLTLEVLINLTYLPVLIRLQKVFGGNIKKVNMEKAKKAAEKRGEVTEGKWKQQWHWMITDRVKQLKFLKTIEPHLQEKRTQVILSIRFLEESYFSSGQERSKLETRKREWFYDELKRLKRMSLTEEEMSKYDGVISELRRDKNQMTLE